MKRKIGELFLQTFTKYDHHVTFSPLKYEKAVLLIGEKEENIGREEMEQDAVTSSSPSSIEQQSS